MNAMTARTAKHYHAQLSPARGTAISLAAFCAFVTVGSVVATPLAGLAAAEIAGMLVVLLAAIVTLGPRHWRDGLFLHRPRARDVVAATAIGLSMWLINYQLTMFMAHEVGLPTDNPALNAVVIDPPLLPSLLCVALLPAICEELWFRGFWLRHCVSRWPGLVSVVVVSVGFAAFHVSWAQSVSTLVLGMVLGFVTLQSNSIAPAMWAHLLNNIIGILLSRHELPWLSHYCASHPILRAGFAGTTALFGIVLVAWPRSAAPAQTRD